MYRRQRPQYEGCYCDCHDDIDPPTRRASKRNPQRKEKRKKRGAPLLFLCVRSEIPLPCSEKWRAETHDSGNLILKGGSRQRALPHCLRGYDISGNGAQKGRPLPCTRARFPVFSTPDGVLCLSPCRSI